MAKGHTYFRWVQGLPETKWKRHRTLILLWPQANTEVIHQNSALLKATTTALGQKLIGWKKAALRISLMAYRNAPHFVPGPLSYRTGLKGKLTLKVGRIWVRKLFLEIWQNQKWLMNPGISTRNLSVHNYNYHSFVFEVIGDVNNLLKQILLNIMNEKNGKSHDEVKGLDIWISWILCVCSFILGHQVKKSMKIK